MKNIITIEYCTGWGYLERAVALTQSILDEQKQNISEITLFPSSGGVFEVSLNGKLVFSKKQLERHAEENEIEEIIRAKLKSE